MLCIEKKVMIKKVRKKIPTYLPNFFFEDATPKTYIFFLGLNNNTYSIYLFKVNNEKKETAEQCVKCILKVNNEDTKTRSMVSLCFLFC